MYSIKKFVRSMQKTFKNKLLVMSLLVAGILVALLSNDGTFLVFALIVGLPLFLAKEDWFYKPED